MTDIDDYPVVDQATLLQSRLHSLFIRKHLENTERQERDQSLWQTIHYELQSHFEW